MKLGKGYIFTGVCHSVNGGVWCRGSCLLPGDCLLLEGSGPGGGMATGAGSMHPTGMHSCGISLSLNGQCYI